MGSLIHRKLWKKPAPAISLPKREVDQRTATTRFASLLVEGKGSEVSTIGLSRRAQPSTQQQSYF